MDYLDAATMGTLSHIEKTLPSMLHLHFYPTLLLIFCAHVLISNEQFLLLINVPIQDQSQQLSIYKILLLISHMVISQLTMIPILSISELHRMKPWQWKSQLNSSGLAGSEW